MTGARRSTAIERYLPEWLEAARLRGCRPRTLEAYEDKLCAHVLPTLGKIALDRLTAAQAERLYSQKLEAELSANTVAQVHVILGNLLKHAKRRGILGRNVLDQVDPPKVPKYQARPLPVDESGHLLQAVRGHKHGPL